MMRALFLPFLALCLVPATPLLAADDGGEESAISGTLLAPAPSPPKKGPILVNYMGWLVGPRVGALDGVPGEGRNMTWKNFATVGYRFSSKTRITLTQYFSNPIRSDGNEERALVFHDPHLTLNSSSLWKNSSGTNLAGYLRYYLPFSHDSADRVGKRKDTKNGVLRAKVEPSQAFLDRDILFTPTFYVYHYLAGAKPDASTPAQRDWRIWMSARVSVRAADGVFPYVAYSNVVEHYRFRQSQAVRAKGSWTKLNDDHLIELGADFQPRPSVTLTPYLTYGGAKWTIRESSVGFIGNWAIL